MLKRRKPVALGKTLDRSKPLTRAALRELAEGLLKQMGLGMHNYESAIGAFPPSNTCALINGTYVLTGFSAQARAQEKNTVDPQVRQQMEALNQKFDEAFNQNDAEAVADLFTAGAIEAGPD